MKLAAEIFEDFLTELPALADVPPQRALTDGVRRLLRFDGRVRGGCMDVSRRSGPARSRRCTGSKKRPKGARFVRLVHGQRLDSIALKTDALGRSHRHSVRPRPNRLFFRDTPLSERTKFGPCDKGTQLESRIPDTHRQQPLRPSKVPNPTPQQRALTSRSLASTARHVTARVAQSRRGRHRAERTQASSLDESLQWPSHMAPSSRTVDGDDAVFGRAMGGPPGSARGRL